MFKTIAQSAKKALSLKKDSIFRLLVVMTALLGWVTGVGAGGLSGLENLYQQWQLEQKSKISVYLLADSDAEKISQMKGDLRALLGVEDVGVLATEKTEELLAPWFEGEKNFPLPIVLEVTVDRILDRESFDGLIHRDFPEAEIDDARSLLVAVSRGVRFAQIVTIGFAVVMFMVMALLVSLTVRAGLRGKMHSLAILQYVGATDRFIVSLVTRQVMVQSIKGWFGAAVLSLLSVFAVQHWLQAATPYISEVVWASVVVVPFVLVFIATVSAWMTSYHFVRKARP